MESTRKVYVNKREVTSMRIAIALFDSVQNLESALSGLQQCGFDASKISVLGAGEGGEVRNILPSEPEEEIRSGATIGAGVGGVLGFLGGVSLLTIPGFGPVLAAGAIVTGAGTAMGGFFGAAFAALGVNEPENTIKQALAEGGRLIVVEVTPELEASATSCLESSGATYSAVYQADDDTIARLSDE